MSGRLRSNHREPAPGHGPAKQHLVQWRERSHGRGNSRPHPCGRSKDRRPTSDRDSPRRRTDMREPANKRLITVVSRLAPPVARSSHNNFSRVFGEGGLWLRRRLDNGHKRMRSVGLSSIRPIRLVSWNRSTRQQAIVLPICMMRVACSTGLHVPLLHRPQVGSFRW